MVRFLRMMFVLFLVSPVAFSLACRQPAHQEVAKTIQKVRSLHIEDFFELLSARGPNQFEEKLSHIAANWDESFTPMVLEVSRLQNQVRRKQIHSLLEEKTGQNFGSDIDKWWQWHWAQKVDAFPDYDLFKAEFYRRIDNSFAKYFEEADNATIRLDEVRWGGVKRDGIPPLKDPEMISAKEADYLADSDVVFGIELNGDARCYPKRILAWHEMFKDTIGGESVCGVY